MCIKANSQKLKCMFGFHQFDTPWTSNRIGGNMVEMKLCSQCRCTAAVLPLENNNTIYQLDENGQPISWESNDGTGEYVSGVWFARYVDV